MSGAKSISLVGRLRSFCLGHTVWLTLLFYGVRVNHGGVLGSERRSPIARPEGAFNTTAPVILEQALRVPGAPAITQGLPSLRKNTYQIKLTKCFTC